MRNLQQRAWPKRPLAFVVSVGALAAAILGIVEMRRDRTPDDHDLAGPAATKEANPVGPPMDLIFSDWPRFVEQLAPQILSDDESTKTRSKAKRMYGAPITIRVSRDATATATLPSEAILVEAWGDNMISIDINGMSMTRADVVVLAKGICDACGISSDRIEEWDAKNDPSIFGDSCFQTEKTSIGEHTVQIRTCFGEHDSFRVLYEFNVKR